MTLTAMKAFVVKLYTVPNVNWNIVDTASMNYTALAHGEIKEMLNG
jgi:hypothetical protein